MNHTSNYQLSQWEKSDRVLMEDFNEDNAKIDAALKAESDARTAAVASLAAQVAGKGNCRIYTTSYVGTGQYGEGTSSLSFPGTPAVVVISGSQGYLLIMVRPVVQAYARTTSGFPVFITWNGNSVSWHAGSAAAQLNDSRTTYSVVALLAS